MVIARDWLSSCRLLLALLLPVSAAPGPAAAAKFTELYSFTGKADGAFPSGGVIQDASGNLYGETQLGASECVAGQRTQTGGCGTVYKIDPTGKAKTLVTFDGSNGAVGASSLTLQGTRLFGTAELSSAGYGMLFTVRTDGSGFQVLHWFKGTDGAYPEDRPIAAGNDLLYGVTTEGGPSFPQNSGLGVLYSRASNGVYTVLHAFTGRPDGLDPQHIIMDRFGTIFGSTQFGGAYNEGIVFSFVPSTGVYTVLYSFHGGAEGSSPWLGSIDHAGTLFGATSYGGDSTNCTSGCGTLFALNNIGGVYHPKLLWSFEGIDKDSQYPYAGPVLSADGALIGTTLGNGQGGGGILYSYANGTLTTLYAFSLYKKSKEPPLFALDAPAIENGGVIVGTTGEGGNGMCYLDESLYTACGTVFRYTPN